MQQLEPLIELDPKGRTARLTRACARGDPIRARRPVAALSQCTTAVNVCKVPIDHLPTALGRGKPGLVAGRTIAVEHRHEGGHLVTVWVVGLRHVVFRDCRRVARNQRTHPHVVTVHVLRDLHVSPLCARGLKVHAGRCNLPLFSVCNPVVEIRLVDILPRVVEPVVEAAHQGKGLGVSALSGLDEALREPGACVVTLLSVCKPRRVERQHVARALVFAGVDAINDCVEHRPQLRVVRPAQRVSCAHQKSARVRPFQIVVPHRDGRTATSVTAVRHARPHAEGMEHVGDVEGSQQVVTVRLHGRCQQRIRADVDASDRDGGQEGDRPWARDEQPGVWGWVVLVLVRVFVAPSAAARCCRFGQLLVTEAH